MYREFRIALILIVSLFAISANGDPMAYSINSDSGNTDHADSLYLIDLQTGTGQRRGRLESGIVDDIRRDTEGLAFSPDNVLWGIDDNSRSMFPINTGSGAVSLAEEIPLPGFPIGGGNDFGMTFSCDYSLYVTSVATQTLYQLDLQGNMQVKGSKGSLGVNISAIAAKGTPTELYGLGNGQLENGSKDAPNLYSIDVETGVATLIGPLGDTIGEYNQGGLAFDSDGGLWAITDRRIINNSVEDLPSQILSINIETGAAIVVSDTGTIDGVGEVGFESLAIGPPSLCDVAPPPAYSDQLTEDIPALGMTSRLLAILLLMLAGINILRRHSA